MELRRPVLVLLFAAAAAACSPGLRSYEVPVGVQLRVKNDKKANVVAGEKAIRTEAGDPFGVFIEDVRRKLGRDPAIIDVEQVDLDTGPASAMVLGNVFSGTVQVLFQLDETGSNYPVAAGEVSAATAAPFSLVASFDADLVPDGDYLGFLAGTFKVSITGPVAPGLPAKPIDVDVRLTLTFSAYE
jgi:hypothetical protein